MKTPPSTVAVAGLQLGAAPTTSVPTPASEPAKAAEPAKPAEPFAFADFTWMNSVNAQL